jgi:glycolate oxidase FAD binding subunit
MSAMAAPTSAAELAAIVRDAAAAARPLAVTGAGSWALALGRVRSGATPVSMRALRGIVEYVPGDLTLTARAGTTLAEIEQATAAHGQWCPLFPWGTDDGTLGATFATGTTGPFRAALGAPRDLALGLEFVDGTGAIARGGGRVVKNVAGFDLTRLMVGSWGTLGIVTEISVRLRARPAVDRTLAVTCDLSDANVIARLEAFRRGPYQPLGCVTLSEVQAGALALGDARVLVRVGGNAAFVDEGVRRLATVGSVVEVGAELWSSYRALDPQPRRFGDVYASPLAARVRAQFDPHGILNSGVLGSDIA